MSAFFLNEITVLDEKQREQLADRLRELPYVNVATIGIEPKKGMITFECYEDGLPEEIELMAYELGIPSLTYYFHDPNITTMGSLILEDGRGAIERFDMRGYWRKRQKDKAIAEWLEGVRKRVIEIKEDPGVKYKRDEFIDYYIEIAHPALMKIEPYAWQLFDLITDTIGGDLRE